MPQQVGRQVTVNGLALFTGGRGQFNILQNTMDKSVLVWLQAEPLLHRSARANGWTMKIVEEKDRRGENGVKLELSGHLGPNKTRPGLKLNGKAADVPQWARWRAWAAAWRLANAEQLQAVQAKWFTALRALPPDVRGLNGQAFLADDIMQWVADLGSMQVMTPTDRDDPEHYDGGASFLHLGVTLWGRRTISFQVKELGGELRLQTAPGHVYFGSLCSALHHVEHKKKQCPDDLLALTARPMTTPDRTFDQTNREKLARTLPFPF